MPILNYTTQIAAEKTVLEIQAMLSRAKAQAVLSEYDEDGVLCALSFRIRGGFGTMSYKLPAKVDSIYKVLVRQKISRSLQTRAQASRVAWRIIKDWLEAQLALISAEMVEFEQVFLPYAQNAEGVTLYETLKDQQFAGLALQDRVNG